MSRASLLGISRRIGENLTEYFLLRLLWPMSEKTPPTWILERGKELMHCIYEFHEAKSPGNFYRNHLDLIVSTVCGRVNRYILVPYAGVQTYKHGISDNVSTMVTMGTMEVMCFVLFVTYFSPMKKTDILRLFSREWFKQTTLQMSSGYAKWSILRYPYFYKLSKIFPENCPKSYLFIMRTSLLVQNTFKNIA